MNFWLGTHRPNWLELTDVPLFVSHRTLGPRRSLPRARGPWALDSGGFSELTMYGEWRTTPRDYVAAVRRYRDEIGNLSWAAIQDWMCEPWLIAKTGLSVLEHQARTIQSLLDLRMLAPELPWMPVVQGWRGSDYLRHVDAYERHGVTLPRLPLVGIGSVCRRQGTKEGGDIFKLVSWLGIRLHGFGVKLTGLTAYARYLSSADSLAWSYMARRNPGRCPAQSATHKNCANCLPYALRWRERVVRSKTFMEAA
jgi:hypothetical protein